MHSGIAPPAVEHIFNQSLYGFYGQLGAQLLGVRFIQTALHVSEINKLTLVSEIPDSEKWPVRELFQRDIDDERIAGQGGLIPYFKGADKIKFFNPLTIVALPIGPTGRVLHSVTETESVDTDYLPGRTSRCFTSDGHYRIRTPENQPQFSMVEWNSDRVKLVAVDGQHRLCALKRLYSEYARDSMDPSLASVDFSAWIVPMVLLIFPAKTNGEAQLLESMRDIFVTINTEAKKPTRCRSILLNDYSLTARCCQELLDHCHRDSSAEVPLLFFDWRAHSEGIRPENPAAFMRVEELEDVHKNYLLQSDEDQQDQYNALFVDDMEEPLVENDPARLREQLRERYREIVMPAITYILSNFLPLKPYVEFLKNLNARCVTDIQKHALSELMFGTHHGPEILERQISIERKNLEEECNHEKGKIPFLFRELIGCRGIFSGFKLYVDSHNDALQTIIGWLDAAKLYTAHMNRALNEKFFDRDSPHLVHICFDPTKESIIHYRLQDQKTALGAYCGLLSCVFSSPRDKFTSEIEDYLDILHDAVLKGYKRQIRPQIKEENPTFSPKQINDLVSEEAQKRMRRHLNRLKNKLGINA